MSDFYTRALTAAEEEQYQTARSLLAQALEHAERVDERAEAHGLLASIEYAEEDYELALRHADKAIELWESEQGRHHPDLEPVLDVRAQCLLELEREDEAEAAFHRLRELQRVTRPQIGRLRDAVVRAFERLRREGFLAEDNHLCCSTCAVADLVDRMDGDVSLQGAVYWHSQDEDTLWDQGLLYLRYVERPGNASLEVVEVGRRLVRALRAEELDPEWDEDPTSAILLRAEG